MSVVLFVPSVYERINYTLQSIDFSEQSSSIKIDPSIQARLDMWKTATTFIKESPIKGNGFSGYRDGIKTLIADGKDVGHIGSFNMPHNEYVHLLVSGGLISLTLLLLILVTLIKIFSSFQPNSSFKVAGYLLVIQFLVFSISEIFFSTKLTIIYFCIASALIIYAGLNEDQKHDH